MMIDDTTADSHLQRAKLILGEHNPILNEAVFEV